MNTLFFYLFSKLTKNHDHDTYWRYYFDFTKTRKFEMLKSSLDESSDLLKAFSSVQKVYHGFARLAYLYRYKKTPIQNTTDLGFNPITPGRRSLTFLHEGARYTMTVPEIIQTVNASLSNVNGFFIVNNYMPKNPYTNVPFTKSILYNMYFKVKESNFKMSALFHVFFMYHFDLAYFTSINNRELVEYAIYRYVFYSHFSTLYPSVKNMINNHGLMRQLYIDPEFPIDVLVDAMRPFLLLSLRLEYANISEELWETISIELLTSLNIFYMYNQKFGRKYIHHKNKKRVVTFEDKYTVVLIKKIPALTISF